ncbi:ABC transporter permease [Oceanobacillus jordanicus]|uniref:ABC transporter permease n=1 Tax=Oceanobacillus jordanicus TaxID=2867266 RepID=A0AAW5BB76_9BACI|nr:ABC transporter permease [Oceanobacillus jordanicus]MCG3420659.1 ABC transporter permease [Oceanobacillus jordanicus]
MRFPAAFLYDIKIQFRHGLYAVYMLVSLFYIIALHQIPEQYREIAGIFITFSDPGVLGFFFIGGLVLLEQNQNILDNLFITPYKVEEYIFSKALSLTVLSVLTSYIIHISVFGVSHYLVLFLVGVFLTSMFFTIFGLGVAVRCHTLNGFFFLSSIYSLIFLLPLLEITGMDHFLFMLLPTKGALLLISSGFHSITTWEAIYSVVMLLSWGVIAFIWARKSFYNMIIRKASEGKTL